MDWLSRKKQKLICIRVPGALVLLDVLKLENIHVLVVHLEVGLE